jgi:NAD(P)-dependent dehydrogenase (short-subunit alcohol dehydrogenase family)
MDNRIALVTGGNVGIGFEVVRALAQRGMTVYLGSRNAERGQEAARALADEGDIRPLLLDTTDWATLEAAIETIGRAHGRLDVLVNNAGIAIDGKDAVEADPEIVRLTLETNVHGPARLTQLAVPLLRRSAAGRVVMVSSGAGSLTAIGAVSPAGALALGKPYAYCLSKTAMNGVTVLFAGALRADGIKVNAASPGYVNSAISRFQGTRTPAQGAAIVVKLATLDDDGPTGGFFNDDGVVAW